MKIFFKAVLALILIISAIFVPQNLYQSLNTDKIIEEMYSRREKYFYGVITLWQIDCFEGGKGNRANWLKSIVTGFEKKHNGVFVNVETLSLETANKLISSGQKKPDIISWGTGLELDKNLLIDLPINNQSDFLKEVTFLKAVPWCMGAYFMIGDGEEKDWGNDGKTVQTKKATKTVYSVGYPNREGYVSLEALKENCSNSFNDEKALFSGTSQEIFEAYNYSKKVNRMIGTQRDFYRLATAQTKENARTGNVKYLGYTDLLQYVSVFKNNNQKKTDTMIAFVEYLLNVEQQNKLSEIGMFPVFLDAEPEYDNIYMQNEWQNIKKHGIKSASYIFDKAMGTQQQKNCLDFLQKKE